MSCTEDNAKISFLTDPEIFIFRTGPYLEDFSNKEFLMEKIIYSFSKMVHTIEAKLKIIVLMEMENFIPIM